MESSLNKRSVLLLALIQVSLLGGAQSIALDAPKDAQKNTNKQDTLDEVIISAHKEKLSALRKDIEKTEDRFIEAYNKINTVPEYQIRCRREVHTGTNISVRECKPKFVESATEEEAREYQLGVATLGGLGMSPPGVLTSVPSESIIAEKVPGYQKHLLEVINKNSKLRKLIHEQEALEKHYQELRNQKFNGHWFVRD
jgi:hypothetical protein